MPEPTTTPGSNDLLHRLADDVESKGRKRRLEIASALLLSLATVASAWCAYQSTLWSGVQTFRLAAAGTAGRKSTQSTVVAMQGRAVDASMLISYMEAKARNDGTMEEFLYRRFRPEMKVAVDAWLKTDPFNDPAAPPSPFKMAEYQQPELAAAVKQDQSFDENYAHAQWANQTSDRYVLLTVLFASVLFFAGIGGTFNSALLRASAFAIASVLFVTTVGLLVSMPICRE